MPQQLQPSSLYLHASKEVASHLLLSCVFLDRLERLEELKGVVFDLKSIPIRRTPRSKEEVYRQLGKHQLLVLDWLANLPDLVVQDVAEQFLRVLEQHMVEDMDNHLVMINLILNKLAKKKVYFGLYSLLTIIQGFQISQLKFSNRLWYCMSQYGEITPMLVTTLPSFRGLTSLNIAHIATDQLVATISRHLANLLSLNVSGSEVTDDAIRFIAGQQSLCCKLEQLKLLSCEGVTDTGIIVALENLKHLRKVEYQQKFSLLEILIMWCTNGNKSEKMLQFFKITEIKHVFPCGLIILQNHLTRLAQLLPHLASLTLVTLDTTAGQLAQFPRLQRLTLELEDCLGPGTLQLLTQLGSQLLEVSISCSSDPDAAPPLEDELTGPSVQVQQGQLLNAVLVAVGESCPHIRRLGISGLGMVSTEAVTKLDIADRLNQPSWLRDRTWFSELASLSLMSYEDSMTVHSGLLRSVLTAAVNLREIHMDGYFTTFINDTYFLNILQLNPMKYLNTISISVSDGGFSSGARIPMGMRTVEGILRSCDNIQELKVSNWSVSAEEFSKLVIRCQQNNWDLTLVRRN